jgi:hypothetical protein
MENNNIFISYAGADESFAIDLAKHLGKKGLLAMKEGVLTPGDEWESAFRTALNSAKAVVVLLSESSISSGEVMFEYGAARATGKKVIPVLIANGTWQLPQTWQSVQYIDGTKTDRAQLADLIEAELLN